MSTNPQVPDSVQSFITALEDTLSLASRVKDDVVLSESFRRDAKELYDAVNKYLVAVDGVEFEVVRNVPLYRNTVQPVLHQFLDDAFYCVSIPKSVESLNAMKYLKPGVSRWDRELASWRSTLKKHS